MEITKNTFLKLVEQGFSLSFTKNKNFPEAGYEFDTFRLRRKGESELYEVPVLKLESFLDGEIKIKSIPCCYVCGVSKYDLIIGDRDTQSFDENVRYCFKMRGVCPQCYRGLYVKDKL